MTAETTVNKSTVKNRIGSVETNSAEKGAKQLGNQPKLNQPDALSLLTQLPKPNGLYTEPELASFAQQLESIFSLPTADEHALTLSTRWRLEGALETTADPTLIPQNFRRLLTRTIGREFGGGENQINADNSSPTRRDIYINFWVKFLLREDS